jgi:uncharacterized membrane protein YjgN (DUF898 family)
LRGHRIRRNVTLALSSSGAAPLSSTAPVAPTAAGQPVAPELKLEFRGDAREYFRIWIVNLCLTLLTLGIFSAWAKVRKKRYFYAHTVLDGTPFQYLGRPLPILKGRLVAAALFIVYYFAGNLSPAVMPYVFTVGLVLAPWVISRSAAFNARYSAFRNMTFAFDGDYQGAARTVYWLGLAPVLAVGFIFDFWEQPWLAGLLIALAGLLFPWWIARLKRFVFSNTRFGGQNGELAVRGGQFWRIYFLAGLLSAFLVAIAGVLTSIVLRGWAYGWVATAGAVYIGYVAAFAYVQANSTNLVWNNATLGPLRFQSTLATSTLLKLYLTNALAILASFGLLIPWAVMRTLQYRLENVRILVHGGPDTFYGDETGSVTAAGAEVGEFFDLDLSL